MNIVKGLALPLCLLLAASPVLAADKEGTKAEKAEKAVPKAAKKAAPRKKELTTHKEKLSYSVGFNTGYGLRRNLDAQSIDVDFDLVKQGFVEALSKDPSRVPEQEIREILMNLQKDLEAKRKEAMAKQQEQMKEEAEKNKKAGDAFLKENSAKEGVKVTPSGLQYKIVAEGKGKSPEPNSVVSVNYRGTLIDGTEFDSSYKRGTPATFQLNQVIKGWTEGLQLIKEGGKIQLFVPSDLGYGDRGAGQQIQPGSTLIFDVELISVQEPPTAPAGEVMKSQPTATPAMKSEPAGTKK
ncbi:MAG: FKBP-type peptidyl-prolyl cis-trans isomerase [Nitrospiraceae bacterium]|nr:FKBP-type peptidyl-prolyl cis-trans isomerase [Nitrospiraceae bacterium]